MKLIIFSLLLTLLTSCGIATLYKENKPNPLEIIGPVLSTYQKKVAKARGYSVFGTGASMPGLSIKYLTISFKGNARVDVPEARRIFLELIEGFVDEMNHDLTIRPYLENYPVTWRNTNIDLDFLGKETPGKQVSLIYIEKDTIFYKSYDEETKQFKKFYSEPYEEALEILRKEKEETN